LADIPLDGIAPEVLRAVLRYVYTNDDAIDADNVVELLAAADQLLLEDLKQLAERFLIDAALPDLADDSSDADLAEARYLAGVAERYRAPKLYREARQLLARAERK